MQKVDRQLRELREQLTTANDELSKTNSLLMEVEHDRERFRTHFAKRFRWWIQLLGESKKPHLSWLVEDDAKLIRDLKKWPW